MLGANRVQIFCPKRAIPGWQSEMKALGVDYPVTNYEQAGKLLEEQRSVSRRGFDLVVIDEAHNLGAFPKPSARTKNIHQLVGAAPVLCLSGTPCVESASQLFWSYYGFSKDHRSASFYSWFRRYGVPRTKYFSGRNIADYSTCKPIVLERFGDEAVTMTQEDAGIKTVVRDLLHEINPPDTTRKLLKELAQSGGVTIDGCDMIPESDMAERNLIHQIETGAVSWGEGANRAIYYTGDDHVHKHLLRHFDPKRTAVMAHYVATQEMLKAKGWDVYSSQAHAEGVDLSHYDSLVVVNTGYSGVKHIQRRERLVNLMLDRSEVNVHFLLINNLNAISQAVYRAVSDKRDFNVEAYRKWRGK